jgi:hypothetical protein
VGLRHFCNAFRRCINSIAVISISALLPSLGRIVIVALSGTFHYGGMAENLFKILQLNG